MVSDPALRLLGRRSPAPFHPVAWSSLSYRWADVSAKSIIGQVCDKRTHRRPTMGADRGVGCVGRACEVTLTPAMGRLGRRPTRCSPQPVEWRRSPMKRLLMSAAVAVVACGVLGVAVAQDIKPRTIKFATQNPKGHPIVIGMEKFAEIVNTKSGGKMKVNLFPGGTLGGDAPNISALQGGTLEMVVMNSGILASQVKEFAVFDFPFMFANSQEADAVVDGPFGKMMLDKLDAKNIHGLAYWELGFRNITNSKRPLNKVEDISGLKLRVIPNAINIDWVSALGANPTPMAFPEVYSALDQKAI